MAFSWRWWLVIVALLGAMMLAACNGDDEGPSGNGPTDEGVATAQPADEAEEADEEEEETEAGGDAFDDVPVPAGAREMTSGSWSGSIPGLVPGMGADPGDFTNAEFKQFEVDDSPSDIFEFYRNNLKGWEEAFLFSGGAEGEEGGIGVWTRDDGRQAIWITAGTSDGVTELVVIRGSAD